MSACFALFTGRSKLLWFLNKYKLHGILCDDMGLGKTLQSICVLAGDHHTRLVQHEVGSLCQMRMKVEFSHVTVCS